MNSIFLLLVALFAPPATTPPATAAQPGIAVLELFTSEGCSSCPPADSLLTELIGDAKHTSRPVYALAFHVDYWNSLGHTDRFSTPEFSQRQREYARALHESSVYTPQLIVNGTSGFVGSDREEARRNIDAGLAQGARVSITDIQPSIAPIPAAKSEASTLQVSFLAAGVQNGDVVHIAFVENDLSTDVKRGENSGRTLKHSAVVRAFVDATNAPEGRLKATLNIPRDAKLDHSEIVIFAQESKSLKIIGANSAPAPKPPAPAPPASKDSPLPTP